VINGDDTYETEVRLWNERDLDALLDALKKPWENKDPGIYTKTGFAGNAKCVISDDGGYLCIRFKGKKDISSNVLEPRKQPNVQDDYISALKDLKQLIEERKQEEEDQTTNPIP